MTETRSTECYETPFGGIGTVVVEVAVICDTAETDRGTMHFERYGDQRVTFYDVMPDTPEHHQWVNEHRDRIGSEVFND